MKGIKCCAECADYSLKKHKCTCGAKDPGKASDSFYADCPLDDAEPVRHGQWIYYEQKNGHLCKCSACKGNFDQQYRYCPFCGAKMEGGA